MPAALTAKTIGTGPFVIRGREERNKREDAPSCIKNNVKGLYSDRELFIPRAPSRPLGEPLRILSALQRYSKPTLDSYIYIYKQFVTGEIMHFLTRHQRPMKE